MINSASLKSISLEKYEKAFVVLLNHLKKEYDYCLIDCPAGVDQGFRFATSVADRAIILTTPHISAIKDASRVLQLLHGTNIHKIELILNEYDEKLVRKKYMLSKKDVEELFDIPILGTIPHDTKVMISQNKGIPVVTMRSKATKQFMCLSEQEKNIMPQMAPNTRFLIFISSSNYLFTFLTLPSIQ